MTVINHNLVEWYRALPEETPNKIWCVSPEELESLLLSQNKAYREKLVEKIEGMNIQENIAEGRGYNQALQDIIHLIKNQ